MFKKMNLFLGLLVFCTLVGAQDEGFEDLEKDLYEPTEKTPGYVKPKPEESWQNQALQSNKAISEWFDTMAEGLDLFLVGEQVSTRKNESSIRIENSSIVSEDEAPQNNTGLSINLRLPNVEDYWQLKFTSYDEVDEKRGVDKGYLRTTPRERNYGASVGFFQKLGSVKASFVPRIELSDPLQVSHSLSFESLAQYEKFHLNPKFELFANATKGTGVYMAFNFFFPLSEIYSFVFLNNGEYQEKKYLYLGTNGFSLGQLITEKSSLAYNLVFKSINRPGYHLESYLISVGWNHLLKEKILDYQVIPYLAFPRVKNFKGTPGATLNINLNF